MVLRTVGLGLVAGLALAGAVLAQTPPPAAAGPKLAAPKVYPAPGVYPTTESVTLFAPEPGAVVRYTLDGSQPTESSSAFDPSQVLFLGGVYDGDRGLKAGYTLRAVTTAPGRAPSDVANFQYVIDRRDRQAYISEEILPGVRMIRDSDNDKMFLIQGSKRVALIDSGMGRGDLPAYLSAFTGGLPIDVIFTHSHGDHIGQSDQLIGLGPVYIGEPDVPAATRLLKSRGVSDAVIAERLKGLKDGARFDLGDRSLVVYALPGHTPGSIVILDEKTGNLFTGDSFGSNSPTIPDAFWLHTSTAPLDEYMAAIKSARAKLKGRVKRVLSGHNDRPLDGETYLNNLETALQTAVDKGDAALIPSYRPPGFYQVMVGDRFTDPDWVAVNVNKAKYLRTAPAQNSALVTFGLEGAALDKPFTPGVTDYAAKPAKGPVRIAPLAVASAARSVTVNGKPVARGASVPLARGAKARIVVTSPDGSSSTAYRLTVGR